MEEFFPLGIIIWSLSDDCVQLQFILFSVVRVWVTAMYCVCVHFYVQVCMHTLACEARVSVFSSVIVHFILFQTRYPLNLYLMVLMKLTGYFTPRVYFLSLSLNLKKYYPGSLSSGVTDVCLTCCKSELRSSCFTKNHFIDFDVSLVLNSLLLNSLLCMYRSRFVYLLSQ